jgi:hypothetical protein
VHGVFDHALDEVILVDDAIDVEPGERATLVRVGAPRFHELVMVELGGDGTLGEEQGSLLPRTVADEAVVVELGDPSLERQLVCREECHLGLFVLAHPGLVTEEGRAGFEVGGSQAGAVQDALDEIAGTNAAWRTVKLDRAELIPFLDIH